jgi:hypothetical protein
MFLSVFVSFHDLGEIRMVVVESARVEFVVVIDVLPEFAFWKQADAMGRSEKPLQVRMKIVEPSGVEFFSPVDVPPQWSVGDVPVLRIKKNSSIPNLSENPFVPVGGVELDFWRWNVVVWTPVNMAAGVVGKEPFQLGYLGQCLMDGDVSGRCGRSPAADEEEEKSFHGRILPRRLLPAGLRGRSLSGRTALCAELFGDEDR